MKKKQISVLILLLATIFLAGCPWRQRIPAEFTSADVYGGNYRDGLFAVAGEATAMEEDGNSVERELVEPDVIRQQGNLIYVLNQYRGLTIVDLNTESVLSQTPTFGYPRDLYLVDGRAYILVSYAQDVGYEGNMLSVSYGSKLYVLNVANPAEVFPEGIFSFEGDLVDSRVVGDVIYAVCSDYTSYDGVASGDAPVATDAVAKSYGSTWAVSLNIADPAHIAVADRLSFSGYGNLIQATNYAIFSVSTNWNYDNNTSTSVINYIDITDPQGKIKLRGVAHAPGYMADRFKMDAWNGALRVVTNTGWPNRNTYITTFDIANPDNMAQLGQTTLASALGESLFATRFDGPLAYVVTYFTVDPLFVVDLSDPANPQMKGELKIPGWSTHIEPRGDRLIALGVDDADGERKVMVSLFDVTVPENPQRIAYESFGEGWAWSSAYSDVKAFTVMDDMLLIPFSGWNGVAGGYDRLQFVSWNRDGLGAQGYVDLQGSAVRSFAYDGLYYAVTQEQLAVIDATDLMTPSVAASVTLAENIADVAPLSNGWIVEVVTRNDKGDTVLRASHAASGAVGAAITLPIPYVTDTFVWNNAVAVVGSIYEYDPEYSAFYQVSLVDFTTPDQPVLRREWQVALEPWWGGWGWYYPMMEDGVAWSAKNEKQYWGGYRGDGNSICLVGDYLVLRGVAEKYDVVYGNDKPSQGIALVDLAGAEPVYLAGLGYKEVVGMEPVDGRVYITSKKHVGVDREQRSLSAYYLQVFNPATREMDLPLNVPGAFLKRIPGTAHLVFEDVQYGEGWDTITVLRSASITDNEVTVLDSINLPSGYWDILADNNKVWYCGQHYIYDTGEEGSGDASVAVAGKQYYGDGHVLGSYLVDGSGKFSGKQEVLVGMVWCSILAVKENQAFISIGSAALARYDFELAPPAIGEIVPVMGYPTKIRFAEDTAYAPLGYSGVGILSF